MKLSKSYRLRIISQNTLGVNELIEDCLGFLHSLLLDQETASELAKVERQLQDIENAEDTATKNQCGKEILYWDIFSILDDIAPNGCYFGSHPEDRVLIGFWEKALFSR